MPISDNYVSPGSHRYLRACMVCSVVMTYQVFICIFLLFYLIFVMAEEARHDGPDKLTDLFGNLVYSASAPKGARTVKSFSNCKTRPTRLRPARAKFSRDSSPSPIRPHHGSPGGSASVTTSQACMRPKCPVPCPTMCAPW